MRHFATDRHLSLLVAATCCAAALAALEVSNVRAQEEPATAVVTDLAAEPEPWQPQLAELREQLASLREELDELRSRPAPDAELEIKRLDEKLDLLQALLSKPDPPSKADLDSLRDFLSLQDEIVEQGGRLERKRIEETLDTKINSFLMIGAVFTFVISVLGGKFILAWVRREFRSVAEKELPVFRSALETLVEETKTRAQKELDNIKELRDTMGQVSAAFREQPMGIPANPEVKTKLENLLLEISGTKDPSEYSAQEWYLKGAKAYWDENWKEAIECLSASIEKDPENIDAYLKRGNALVNSGQLEDSVTDYSKAIEIKPDYFEAYNNRGNSLVDLERYEEALADYAKAIEITPRNARPYLNAAEMQIVIGRPDAALKYRDSATPHVQAGEDRAVSAWLTCIATALHGKDTSAANAAFDSAIANDFKRTWRTDEIERWLETAELDEEVRAYIREKIEQFKAR